MSELLTREEVDGLVGGIAAGEYESAPEYAKAELSDWLRTVRDLSDEDLAAECRRWIYEGALVQRFRMNFDHIHCRATACYSESARRLTLAGHERHCHGPSIYSRAHASTMRDHGYQPSPEGTCVCEGVKSRV